MLPKPLWVCDNSSRVFALVLFPDSPGKNLRIIRPTAVWGDQPCEFDD
jgi:hypothetical protein